MNVEQLKHAAQLGAIFELAFLGTLMGPTAHLTFMPHWKRVSAEDNAAAIRAVGAHHFINWHRPGANRQPLTPGWLSDVCATT
jgi:hypothetical protein